LAVPGKLSVLVCEDNEDDFALLLLELRRAGYQPDAERVQTANDLRDALNRRTWDIVISDWSMPSFSAPAALRVLGDSHLDLPFIIVSGTVGEEAAVEALRNGAHDFLVKSRLARLGIVIDRELREANARRERARMQDQLMISDRMASVGVLAAGVAHEINNPLAAVIANLEMALEDIHAKTAPLDRASLEEELADARTAAERVRNIVRDLRMFSRTEDERRGSVVVEKVMDSTLRMATNEIRHRARLIKEYKSIPPIEASEARLGQVFLNLLVNAAQALPDGQADKNEIRIVIDKEGDRARIDISDTGPGIEPEVMKRLFTPFYTTKPASIGTGLGLSICHRIVTGLGGEILVDSKPGTGTTFTVLLPFGGPVGEEAETQPLPLLRAARRGRVLIIDDEPIIARAIQRALEGDKHETIAVTRGGDALELIERGERFDVIVCDLMMPEMTGADLHAALKQIAPDQARAIIFLTGGAFTLRAQEFLDSVENLRVEKPFEPSFLRAVINDRMR
jgi:signal transduction histidine kinase